LTGVTCGSANLLPATSKCYRRDGTINAAISAEGSCTGENTWFSSAADEGGLQAVCHNRLDIASGRPVEDYKIIGCEEGCLTRSSGNSKQDYITGPSEPDTGGATVQGDNREVIYINDQKIPATQDPYVSTETELAAGGTFNVTATCGTVTESDGTSVTFSEPFGPVDTAACNLDPNSQGSDHLESRRYSVKGCYPTCPPDERCINMLFSYSVGAPVPELDPFKEQLLQQYIVNTTTSLTGVEQQQFKDQIYYYRKFRHDGLDHIEAQFKCADADCEFADASIDAAITALGGTASQARIMATERGMDVAIDAAIADLNSFSPNFASLYDFSAAMGLGRDGSELASGPIDISQRIKKWVISSADISCEQTCGINFGPSSRCVDDELWGVTNFTDMAEKLAEANIETKANYKADATPDFECYRPGEINGPGGLYDGASLTEMTDSWKALPGAPHGADQQLGSVGVNPLDDGEVSPPIILTMADNVMPSLEPSGKGLCWWQSVSAGNEIKPEICTKRLHHYETQARKLCQCYVPRVDICRRGSNYRDALSGSDNGDIETPASCAAPNTWEPWQEP
jgi:hypothetical protein